jgi:hypothetical protein
MEPCLGLVAEKPLKGTGYVDLIVQEFEKMKIPCSYNSNGFTPLSSNSKLGTIKFRGYCRTGTKYSSKAQEAPASQVSDASPKHEKECEEPKCTTKFNVYMQPHSGDGPVQFIVRTTGEFFACQKFNTSRQIRNSRRDALRKESRHEKAKKLYLDGISKLQDFRYFHGNLPAQSLDVIRKIRSEGNLEGSNKDVDIDEAINMLSDEFAANPRFQDDKNHQWDGFIQRFSVKPHTLTFFSPQQIKYGSFCDELFIDSTGSLVPNREGRQVLLHSIVGKPSQIKQIPTVPLLEMLSTVGTTTEIESMIRLYASEVRKTKPNWTPKLVVSDFALAYLHANSQAFCEMSLSTYINMKYDHLLDANAAAAYNGTNIFVCSGHFLHFASKYMRRKTLNLVAVDIAMHGFARLIECTSREEYENLVTDIITLFGKKTLDEDARQLITKRLKAKPMTFVEDEYLEAFRNTVKSDVEMEQIFPADDPKLQKEKSKFFQHFKQRQEDIIDTTSSKNSTQTVPTNMYHDSTILATFARWNVYIPLWSKICFAGHKEIPESTITTGNVEQYFGEIKVTVHPIRKVREDIFLKAHGPAALSMVEDVLARGYFKKPGTRRQQTGRKPPEAVWGPKKQKKGPPRYAHAAKLLHKEPSKIPILRRGSFDASQSKNLNDSNRQKDPSVINPDGLRGYDRATIESKVPMIQETEEGPIMRDSFALNEKWWVNESRILEELIKPGGSEVWGNETDILTLRSGLLVSSAVAGRMCQKIVDMFPENIRRNMMLIDPTYVSIDVEGFAADPLLLPEVDQLDLANSRFVMISMLEDHAWLTVVKIRDEQIIFYDSLSGKIENELRKQYYMAMMGGFMVKYGMDMQFNIIEKPTAEQVGNECVQMSLLALKALLLDREPQEVVSPFYARVYRKEILADLLQETTRGQALLSIANGDPLEVLSILEKRQRE